MEPEKREIRKIYGYIRVSDVKQTDGCSPEQQERAIRNYCKTHYDRQPDELFIDVESASKVPLEKRTNGSRLVEGLRRHDVVIIKSVDRGWRSVANGAATLASWKKRGINLVVLDLNLDTLSTTGTMLLQMMMMCGQMESAIKSERTKMQYAAIRQKTLTVSEWAAPVMRWVSNDPTEGQIYEPAGRHKCRLAARYVEVCRDNLKRLLPDTYKLNPGLHHRACTNLVASMFNLNPTKYPLPWTDNQWIDRKAQKKSCMKWVGKRIALCITWERYLQVIEWHGLGRGRSMDDLTPQERLDFIASQAVWPYDHHTWNGKLRRHILELRHAAAREGFRINDSLNFQKGVPTRAEALAALIALPERQSLAKARIGDRFVPKTS